MIKEFNEVIKSRKILLAFFDVLFLIVPGVAMIFIFKRDLFTELDWLKLTLLSASIVAPLAFINALLISASENINLKERDGFFQALSESLIVTGIALYSVSLAGYLFNLSLKPGLIVAALYESGFGAWVLIKDKTRERRENRSKS
jgi:hypothetical protein